MVNNEIHDCKFLPKSGVLIYKDCTLGENNRNPWCLHIQREATEKDLEENGYLENIGDIIWQTCVEIVYCPYCGEKLEKEEFPAGFGKFRHMDFSGWDMKVQ